MKALIVDDNATNVLFLRRLVEAIDGCEALCFTDSLAVSSQLAELTFDIALIDYVMPGLDGLELVKAIRAHQRHALVPLVMITAQDERAVRIDCIKAGANDFLLKPVDPVEFKARVRNLLALHRAQTALAERGDELQVEVNRALKTLVKREEEIVWRLSRATEGRDFETGNHIMRMATVCRILAEELGHNRHFCHAIQVAAQMHDIGKVGIPDHILFKPGALTPDERAIMQTHTTIGEEILAGSESELIRIGAEIAATHHERWDGNGYPRRLAAADIPITGRIAAVADVFDALVSARPYKKPWTIAAARDLIVSERGKQFDATCVDAFIKRFDEIAVIGADAQVERQPPRTSPLMITTAPLPQRLAG
jgi:putative two-component system response regulator